MFGRRVVLTLFHQCWLLGKLFTQCFILNMFELYYIMPEIHTVTCFIDTFWMVCLVKYWIKILKTCLFQISLDNFANFINKFLLHRMLFNCTSCTYLNNLSSNFLNDVKKHVHSSVFSFLLYNMKFIICKTTIYI